MSISADEVNYLIWRYFQEAGLEVSAYALDDETRINTLDAQYSKHVPLGCLVDLLQKGILYSKMNELVVCAKNDTLTQDEVINMNFNFFSALHQINETFSPEERKIIPASETGATAKSPPGEHANPETVTAAETSAALADTATANASAPMSSEKDDFIKVIKPAMSYDPSFSVSFKPNDPSLIGWTQQNSQASIYSLASSKMTTLSASPSCKETLMISWSPDGSSVVTAYENGELHLWSVDGILVSILAMHHWPIISLQWSPNGKFLLSLDIRNVAIIWDISSKSIIFHLDRESWSHLDRSFGALINNPDSTNSVRNESNKNYGTATCWLDDNKFITPGPNYTLLVNQITDELNHSIVGVLIGHEESICCIKYNSHLRLLCSASEDGTIRIYKGNSTNSLQILSGHSLAVSFIAWIKIDSNWYILSTSLDGTIRIWNFFQSETVAITCVDEGQAILNAAIYTDKSNSKILLATGDSSGSVSIWLIEKSNNSTASHKPISIRQSALFQHDNIDDKDFISELAWNSDGSKLAASFSAGKSVIIDI